MLSGRKKINTSISKNVTYIQLTNKTSLQTKSNKPTDREFIRIVGGKNENTLPNRIGGCRSAYRTKMYREHETATTRIGLWGVRLNDCIPNARKIVFI